MEAFFSTFRNRIDAKGRVSVPASFRALLAKQGPENAVYLGPDIVADANFEAQALVAGGNAHLAALNARIDQLPEFSTERADLEDTLLASLNLAGLDPEGRVTLPASLLEHAGLKAPGEAVFVGRGRSFQIWEPKAWDARSATAAQRVKAQIRATNNPANSEAPK